MWNDEDDDDIRAFRDGSQKEDKETQVLPTTSTTRRCVLRSCLEGVPAGGGPACYRVRSAGHTHT